ncbi:epithelial cell-transforming sequence 2 oncogene-like isoform X6 [Mustela putorius furo]|uniref:Epithelial cell-transforming sequence 2 oncogene-like isoform X6 n=1 Tax=Mustela putorius furo TaxID=9669 RepID=A0A8U0NZY3_MUSPF|nr:epithelial cell-transforming sequence 2 oncogene-like isoform X6 [Mustela putorius furo]
MSAGDSSRKTSEMECFHTRFSAWTPFGNKSLNRQLFQERVALISHWFDLWTHKQRQEFLFTIFLRCTKSQLRFVQDWFSERTQVAKVDFSTVLPRFISLYIFSFLNPKELCVAAQVSWPWKFLTEQDCLWMPKCIRFGWFLPYTPTDNEYGAWKRHYIACVSSLDWLIPREASAVYGTLNEPKTEDEELLERQREKCLRKIIWEKIALRKKELFKVRPPWVSGTCCSRLLKSKCQPRLSQALRDRVGLHEALEKQLILASLQALPKRSNVSGSHSYPSLLKKTWRGVQKNDDSSSYASQPHFLLISSRIPAFEMVVDSIKAGIIFVVYEHSGLTLESLLYLIEKALDGQKVQSMGIFSDGDSREINLLQGYKIGIGNLLRPEVRDFWEKLGSCVAPEEEGGHVDLFVPLGASEAGLEVLSQLSQLTGTFFTAPTGIATGSYQHILGDWLERPWERAPCSIYFRESKLQTWSSLTDFLEDTLKSVRKQLSPLFKELQKNISARIIGQFTSDNMHVANILNNQEIAQTLADGLMELSKENSERNVLEDKPQDTKSSLSNNDPNLEMLIKLERKLRMDSAEKRSRVAGELLQSERKYVQMLEIVRDVYVLPLKAALSSNRAILSAANIHIIFSDILQILSLNRQFLDHLRDRLQEWSPAHCVGELFLKFGSQLNTYTNFFNNYPVVLRTIEKMKHNIGMKDQLSEIQRIVWGCPTLLEESRYLIRVQDVAQLHCCDEAVSFSLRSYEHTRDLSLFLFNDALLVSSRGTVHTPFERTSKSTYQFIASVALHRLLVEDIPDSKYIKNAFILHGPKCEWICATEVEDDKFLWLSVLQSAIKSSMEK